VLIRRALWFYFTSSAGGQFLDPKITPSVGLSGKAMGFEFSNFRDFFLFFDKKDDSGTAWEPKRLSLPRRTL